MLNIIIGRLSLAFRKIITLEKTLYECFSWFFLGSGSPRDYHREQLLAALGLGACLVLVVAVAVVVVVLVLWRHCTIDKT